MRSVSRDIPCIGFLAPCTEEHFSDENVFIARPRQLLQALAHLDFTLAIGIRLCCVKGIDAILPGSLQAVLDGIALDCPAISQPTPERKSVRLLVSACISVKFGSQSRVGRPAVCPFLDNSINIWAH